MITVLVIDDSAFYRVNISQLVTANADLRVVATAKDGASALDKIKQLNPDVITIDFELAGISGVEVIKKINETSQKPIIIISAFKDIESESAITSLESGVFDFIEKPAAYDALNHIKEELHRKITAAYEFSTKGKKIFAKKEKVDFNIDFHLSSKKIVVIASSTGGPQTLERFIPDIPGNIPCPVLIVQHMPPVFTKSFADRLNKLSNIRVVEAQEGDELVPGKAYIAPGDFHMVIKRFRDGVFTKEIITLNQNEKEQGVRPCANILFKSIAPLYKENTVAVVLTGMGYDGTDGAREIKKYNGSVIAQSEKTSIIYGMPKSIVDNNLADEVVDIDKMAVALVQLLEV